VKAFTANFSDLSGAANPTGIWSPAFLALKLALDRGEQADNVVQLLYDWLSQRKITPSEVDTILDLEPDAAYQALVGKINGKMDANGLPKMAQDTLRRAMLAIAGNYVTKQEQELERHRSRLQAMRSRFNMRSRFKVESARELVDSLLI